MNNPKVEKIINEGEKKICIQMPIKYNERAGEKRRKEIDILADPL